MKRTVLLAALLVAASACAAPAPSNNSTTSNRPTASTSPAPASSPAASLVTEADALAREKQVYDALKAKNYDAFAAFLAEDQLEVEPTGVYNKAQSVAGVKQIDFKGATLSDFKETKLDADATLVTYMVKSPAKGFNPAGEHHTTLWVNRGGKWLAVFHQGSEVGK